MAVGSSPIELGVENPLSIGSGEVEAEYGSVATEHDDDEGVIRFMTAGSVSLAGGIVTRASSSWWCSLVVAGARDEVERRTRDCRSRCGWACRTAVRLRVCSLSLTEAGECSWISGTTIGNALRSGERCSVAG